MKHIKEKFEDKILKLPPVEVAKSHKEYGRCFRLSKPISHRDVTEKQKDKQNNN